MRSSASRLQLNLLASPVLLLAVVLCVYYPAIGGGIHPIDDAGIFSLYSAHPPLSQVFVPGGGFYYRPLLELSFWLDSRLWGMEPSVMHLENVLLHYTSALLVFLIAGRVLRKQDAAAASLLPLFAALLFALHPANVEAVAWIAGRTDPLLAVFGLSGCYFLVRWLEEPAWLSALLSGAGFVMALLTKETAVAFLPVVMLFLWLWPVAADPALARGRRLIACALVTVTLMLALCVLLLCSTLTSVSRLVDGGRHVDLGLIVVDVAAGLGFYVKKLFFPFPLNFAITEVSSGYAFLAAVALIFLAVAVVRRQVPVLFFLSALLLVMPALVLVVVRNISWIPYAERYLYLPSAFFSLGVAGTLGTQWHSLRARVVPVAVLLLVGCAAASWQRSLLWGDKFAFFQDAVAKSPGFGSLYNELGSQYLLRHQLARAADAFATADRLNRRPSMALLIKANVMQTMVARGEYAAAQAYFVRLFPRKKDAPADFLMLLQTAEGKILTSFPPEAKRSHLSGQIETCTLLHQKTKDPFWLYRCGLLARDQEEYEKSLGFFRQALADAPADAPYRLAAGKQIAVLEKMR